MKKNMGMFGRLPRRGARAISLALFACAACMLFVSSAKAALTVAYWTYPTTTATTAATGQTADLTTATFGVTTGTAAYNHAGTKVNYPSAGGTAAATYSLQAYDSSADAVVTIHLSGTGLSGLSSYVLTYAAQSASAGGTSRSVTWAYSINGTSWTTLQTDTITTTAFATYTDNFSADTTINGATTIYFRGTFGAKTGSGAYFDNIVISAVPEPITYAMAVFGLVFAGGTAGFTLRRKLAAAKTA